MRSKLVFVVSVLLLISPGVANARHSRLSNNIAPECNVTMPCELAAPQRRGVTRTRLPRHVVRQAVSSRAEIAEVSGGRDRIVGGRPAGCPNSYCGCAASLRVFGRIVPGLNLAANWLRFPRTSPAPGMVAARRGHVFVLERHIGGDVWMAYDGNSGGHATRIHARSLRGYAVVNPQAA